MVQAETQTIIDAINALTTSVTALNTKVKAFTPALGSDFSTRNDLNTAAGALETQLNTTISLIKSSPKRSLGEALQFKDPLAKMSTAVAAMLVSVGTARAQFSQALLGRLITLPFVKGHLHQQKALFSIMVQELVNVSDNGTDFGQNNVRSAIGAAFDTQIFVTYSSDLSFYCAPKAATTTPAK